MEFQICSKGHTVTIQPWTSFFTVIARNLPCEKCYWEGVKDNGTNNLADRVSDGSDERSA